jgi:DNA-binding transcriptional MocR family regulator
MSSWQSLRGSTVREISQSVEDAIEQGTLRPADLMPSVRELASALQVSPATVARAFRELRSRGVLTTRERQGTRVSARPAIARRSAVPVQENVRDLSTENPDPRFLPNLAPVLRRLDSPQHLYGESTVLPELREEAARQFHQLGIDPEHLMVAEGTFAAIERILSAHLKPGDRVAVEDPGCVGVLDLIRAMGLHPVGVPVDEDGMDPEILGAVLADGVDAAIVTPRAQNPTGAALTSDRAAELREVLARFPHLLIIEDDYAGPVVNHPYHTLSDNRERWAAVRSVSKSLGPDLRLAVVAGDRVTMSRAEGRQALGPGWVSWLIQKLVVELWREPETHLSIAAAAEAYRSRANALIEALKARGIPARGGSSLTIWLPTAEETPVMRALLQSGWAVAAGEIFRLSSPPGIRITTAVLPEEDAPHLARDIAHAFERTERL